MNCFLLLSTTSVKSYLRLCGDTWSFWMIDGEVDGVWFYGEKVKMNCIDFDVCL